MNSKELFEKLANCADTEEVQAFLKEYGITMTLEEATALKAYADKTAESREG